MSDIEEKAWNEALPRGETPLTPAEEFRRTALAWAGEWLRRAHANPRRVDARPFAVVLSSGPLSSPKLDSHLINKATEDRPLRSYDCPMPFDVIMVTSNLRQASGYKIGFDVASDVIQHVKSSGLHDRHVLVVDPGQLAYGLRDPADEINDFEMTTLELGTTALQLSKDVVDQHLARFHDKFLKLPNKAFGIRFWKNEAEYKTIPNAEKEIQRELVQYFIVLLPEDSVATDPEVTVASGRADVRLLISTSKGLRVYWLELKVLREQDGPSGRDDRVRTCIAQARARLEDTGPNTEAAFACCYDASKTQIAFGTAVQSYADKNPAVLLRRYAVLNKHYVVEAP